MSDETNEHVPNIVISRQEVAGVEWTYIVKDGFAVIGDGSSSAIPKSTSGKIAIPATLGGHPVAKIGNKAFAFCDKLTSVKIPEGVKCIGGSAFLYCESIAKVTIPKGVVSIEPFAFSHCKALTCLTIPESVTSIGNNAFWLCGKLESVWIPGNVASIGESALEHCSSLSSVTISDGVTSIGDSAFKDCEGLASVTIPDSVTSIGNSAFASCWGLTSVTIGNGVTNIGDSAFSDCMGLTSVTMPDGVTNIGNYAFSGCSRLARVTMPNSVTSIGSSAFHGCIGLTSVTMPNSVTCIEDSVFSDCRGLTSVTIPNSVTSIGNRAFDNCKNLTNVAIPNSVTSIGNFAFELSGLTSVAIPDGVTDIGDSAFSICCGLASVTIPNSVTRIGQGAFYGTPFFSKKPDGLVVAGDVLYAIKGDCPKDVKIPVGVKYVSNKVFSCCAGLISVTIPDSVTSIGDSAFEGCTGLTSVTIPDGMTNIGNEAFSKGDNLQRVTIPASVKNIGKDVFARCLGLKNIKIVGCKTSDEAAVWEKWARDVFAGNKLSSDFCKVTTVEKAVGKIDVVAQFGTVADENALPSFMQSAPGKAGEWEQNVHALSHECHALLSTDGLKEEDRRENVSLLLQAAFAIIPEEWRIMNKCDAAQYFFLFCGCLGIHSLTSNNARVEFVQGEWHSSYFLFDFTYGMSANDALRACESRGCPRTEIPDQTRLLFGVNYNPGKRNIDKPLTASFRSECTRHVPNFAASDAFCSEFEWFLTSRDKCGRGDAVVQMDDPMDVKEVLAWLQRKRVRKEEPARKTSEEVNQKEAERIRKLYEEVRQKWQNDSGRGRRYASDEPPAIVKAVLTVILWLLVFFIIKACMR